jgi:hypothetical protein
MAPQKGNHCASRERWCGIISCMKNLVQRNENGLRGRSGERGLNAFANNSSPESLLGVREIGPIAVPIAANPVGPVFFWASCTAEGGKNATGLSNSGTEGLV